MECIEGVVERITYRADDGSGFVVAKIKEPQKKDVTAIVGNLGPINIGENLRLYGFWEESKKYKTTQFRVSSYETLTPATIHGIEKYLGSGIIKGLGEKTAKRIVKKFGLDTFHVIENNPDKLKEVKKVGDGMVEKIKKGWEENKQIKDVMVFLQGQDISPAYASRIYKKYKEKTIAYVKENPYRLADDVNGIGFKKADQIARNFGIDLHSPIRVEAKIIYMLQQLAGEGHVYYPYDMLIEECIEDLDIDKIKVVDALQSLSSSERDRIVIEDIIMPSGKTATGGLMEAKAVYLKGLYLSEYNSSQRLNALMRMKSAHLKTDIDKAIVDFQTESLIMLSELQKEAVKKAVNNKILVITGGPGTGKTTIIRCICSIFASQGFRVGLAAPTGRASKRMEEATGMPAKTIHRLLEYSPSSGANTRHKNNPLDTDIIIIDEFSMVDITLFHHLIDAVPLNARLIMVGDVDQLPSVGAGNVLRDIIASGIVPLVKLTEIHRQKKDSHIIINAHRINHGQKLILPGKEDKDTLWDFYHIEQDDKQEIVSTIVKLCKERIPARFGYNPIDDIQILTPMQVRDLGVVNLNRILQKNLNDSNLILERGKTIYKVGDKVMQTRNNYDKDVFNGDIGKIKIINTENKAITVQFDENKFVNYEGSELDEIVLAYAISIHKSQGSEYKAVIIPIHTQHYIMLKRNLIYTAVTRGKELVILIGMNKAIYIAIKNSTVQSRYTMLSERLVNLSKYSKPSDSYELF